MRIILERIINIFYYICTSLEMEMKALVAGLVFAFCVCFFVEVFVWDTLVTMQILIVLGDK